MVPDSCCKTVVPGCGRRDHASNIYKVEVGRWGLLSGLGCWVAPSPRRLEDSPPSAAPPPVQGGCITKLETFIQEHLRIIGAVGLGIACVQVCVCGGVLGMARVQVCVGGWASPMCRCVVGAVPRPCAVCCGGCASPVCRCVGGAGYRQCTDVVCMGGWASPVCRFVGGWASPVCHVCCGPGLTCSCWPCAQVFGMLFTCCLYKSLKLEHY